ncbi:MAG: pyrroloquinoline-quinone synthase PqqC [Ktedonobacteraceae bacterium]|nr:pyrroloquinoline-quinone synthase PqqC [Ktedonobacteraceae bacterium]
MTTPTIEALMTRDEFVANLKKQGTRYYHTHPLHVGMNAGKLSQKQIQVWAANRYYYQKSIPLKDAAILSNCPEISVRRVWIQRILDHDGTTAGQGGIENWLKLTEAVGLSREAVLDERHLVPGVRFAVDAYVNFARTRPWIEAVAASLTELFAPDLMKERLDAFEQHYDWIDNNGLTYLRNRLLQGPRDASHAVDIVVQYCRTREQQERAIAALIFKCDVLWSMLDSIHHAVEEK